MAHGQAIQSFALGSPGEDEKVHEAGEAAVVGGFEQVGHFVDDDVFEAFAGFAGEIGIEANGTGFGIATAPPGFHSPDEKAVHLDVHERLPLGDEGREGGLELGAIPVFEEGLSLFCDVPGRI